MGLYHSPSFVSSGLLMYLDAANIKSYPGTGVNWNDISGNGNNSSLALGCGYTPSNLGNISCSNGNGYCTTSLNISGRSVFSAQAWIKTGTAGREICGSYTSGNSSGRIFEMYINTTLFAGYVYNSAGAATYRNSAASISDNNWHQVCMVYNGTGRLDVYVDGIISNASLNGAAIPASIQNANTTVTIGNTEPSGGFGFIGNLTNIAFWGIELSSGQVYQNFCAHKGRFGL